MQPPMRRATGLRPPIVLAVVALLLVYALPLFVPPPATPVLRVPPDAPLLTRLFPDVPAWWVVGRLLALLAAAALAGWAAPAPVFRLGATSDDAVPVQWKRDWIAWAALLASIAHALALPLRPLLSPVGQTAFVLWFIVPPALLAAGVRARARSAGNQDGRARGAAALAVGVIGVWIIVRIVVSWHSPRAADLIDMWRIFGGFTQLAMTNGNFLTQPMDPELPGLSAILLFFHGLPILQMNAAIPSLTWMQATNALWLAACAATIAALAAAIVSPSTAVIAAAAFLFSPFALAFQLSPMPSVELMVPALVGVLLVRFYRTGSAAALTALAVVVGISAGMPPLVGITGLGALLAAWRVGTGPPVPRSVLATALLSLVTALVTSIPAPATMLTMYARYAATEVPLAVAEPAVHGQLAPTIEDWLGGPVPDDVPLAELSRRGIPVTRGWLLVPLGAVLAPFAIPRWSLRLWGDAMLEPLSAGLAALALAVCLRYARRDRVSLVVVLFLAAAIVPAFVSSYDRASLLRLLGAPVPLAVLAAAGFMLIASALPDGAARQWAAAGTAAVIAMSGTVLFDVVNPRILAASSLGILTRAVQENDLGRVALLTSYGRDPRPEVSAGKRYWDLDWLRKNHPYIADVVRAVPSQPILMTEVEHVTPGEFETNERNVVFWNPALEQSAGVRDQLCARWPDATLYTMTDASGLSRLHAAQLGGQPWAPALPADRWISQPCAAR